jgi:hypothetical protein
MPPPSNLCALPALLHWQVPGIRARFLALTVHNNINPLNEWSAAPQDIRRACTAAFERYMLKLPVQDTARNSTRGTSEARAHPQHHQGQAQAGALHRTGAGCCAVTGSLLAVTAVKLACFVQASSCSSIDSAYLQVSSTVIAVTWHWHGTACTIHLGTAEAHTVL